MAHYNQTWLDDTCLEFSATQFALNSYGIYTVEQLLTCPEKELLGVSGIGPKRLNDIKEMLKKEGYGELPSEELPSIDGPQFKEHQEYLAHKYSKK